ncbi:20434_t:CDS:2, partial [Cetraspora pellucida]
IFFKFYWDLSQNDHELHIIADVPTRWNSSYLAWQQLIKIRNIIDPMITMLSLDKNYQTQKEVVQLKKINLTDTEWEAIKSLIAILEPFAEATDLLGEVDYDDDESALNDDQMDVESNIPYDCLNIEKRIRMALYNAIKHYWQMPSEEGMLAALLDPRCKSLSFTSESLRFRTHNSLYEAYRQHQSQIDVSSIKQPLQPKSKLLATIANLLSITLEHLIFLNKNRHAVVDIFLKQNYIKANK